VLKRAHDLAAKDPGFVATDDCGVVLRYLPDVPIWVVRGDERNMRITEPIDVYVADKLFRLIAPDLPPVRTEDGYREALEDRTVVVFGGSHGIGADIAALSGKYGAQVRVFSRSGTGTHVQRREDVAAAARDVLAEHGSVDFVVNTAVVLPHGPLAQASEETVYGATEVNYLAPILIAQEFFPHLRQTRGSLLLFTSSAYARGHSGYSLYSSAKAAVANLTQALADEWAPHGVRVNCVNPESNGAPSRADGFANERPGSLLDSMTVARASLDAMLSTSTGRIVDLRRADPASTLNERSTLADGAAAAEITR
jgi:2-C-methyl-D-erythritol 4-phosphate cytidylyltransferase